MSTKIYIACIFLVTSAKGAASHWSLHVENADQIPSSFDCAMRKAAYDYGRKILPRKGDFVELYDALDISSDNCESENGHLDGNIEIQKLISRNDDVTHLVDTLKSAEWKTRSLRAIARTEHSEKTIPKNAVFVAADGHDKHLESGSFGSPFRSIQRAADYAANLKCNSKVVVLREGTHYLSEPLSLTHLHRGLRFIAYPGESPIISGGKELKISSWKPYTPSHKNHPSHYNIWVADISGQVREVPGLQMNGKRCTRARYPNLPGGIETSCGYGCMLSGKSVTWKPPNLDKYGNTTYYTDNIASHDRPDGGWFEHYTIGLKGLCSVYEPPVSYWCSENPSGGGAFPFRTPSGVIANQDILPNSPYQSIKEALFYVWRPGRWANWMFRIDDYDKPTGNFTFGKGGNQGARGENVGGDFFVENLLEELDFPNEFYFDSDEGLLYFFHNDTGPPPESAKFIVPQLRSLVNITGTQWNPVVDIKFTGIAFKSSRYTYMDPHGVPSAGDWALERSAAIFLQGTKSIGFDECNFERLDGNGLMISGFNRNTTIRNSDFSFIGGSAIVAWGYTNETATDPGRPGIALENWPMAGVDGTDGEHPRYTSVIRCTAREVGLYEKQSSFFMQAKASETILAYNAFFNGPRAGINFNDGFGGGDEVVGNLVFSTCRESGDHGPLNTWDRQPFLTNVRTGQPSMQMQWREIHHNFFIDNYSQQENVDNDDGSGYYHTHDNFLVYGRQGMKNDYGGHDNHHYNNIYAYVDHGLGICEQLDGHEDYFYGNKVVMTGTKVGSFACTGTGRPVIHDNEYYTTTGDVTECGVPLAAWQAQGNDRGSKVQSLPADDMVLQWARFLLDF